MVLCTTAFDEQRLVAGSGLHDITLLSGADEAATVAAYRVIKSIAQPTQQTVAARREAGVEKDSGIGSEIAAGGGPEYRLVVAGSDENTATVVWRRLADAAHTFLGLELELAGFMPRISGDEAATILYDGPLTDSISDVLAAMTRQQAGAAVAVRAGGIGGAGAVVAKAGGSSVCEPAQTSADDSDDFFDAEAEEADRLETARAVAALAAMATAGGALGHQSGQAPAASRAAGGDLGCGTGGPADKQRGQEGAGAMTAGGFAATAHAGSIAGLTAQPADNLLDPLGFAATGVVCPNAPTAVIGRCGMGQLHIAAFGGRTQAEHEAAIVALLRTSAWCAEHHELLANLTGADEAKAGKPALHLLSASGPLARQSCIAGIEVSLLVPVPAKATQVAVSLTRSH